MKKYITEFVGTFILVLVACGVAAITGGELVPTALAFGLVIVAMAYSIGNISGCHLNPAVSFAMLMTKRMNTKDFIGYVIAQILGAILGAFLLGVLLGSYSNLGANEYGLIGQLGKTVWTALLVETILTFIFVTVILEVTSKKEYSNVSGLIIGLTLTLVHLFGINFTGTSVNPARSLAPAIFQGGEPLSQVWVFIVAPLIGSFLAALFYQLILLPQKRKS